MSIISRSTLRTEKPGRGIGFPRSKATIVFTILLLAGLILSANSLIMPQMVRAEEADPVSIIDASGQVIMNDPPPLIIENQIMVPVAALAGSLQAKAVWDADLGTVTVTRSKETIRMRVDSDQATINGEDLSLEAAVCNINGRVYVPLLSMAEALGAKVELNEESRTAQLLPGMGTSSSTRDSTVPGKGTNSSATLTVKVGYFGTPYKTLKVFTLSDLEAMPQVQQAYTFIDTMPSVVLDSAQGVKLTDVLHNAGIDINSIDKLYFYTTDAGKSWYQSLPKTFLLDTERYYYPNLPTHWDYDEAKALPGAEDGAIPVEPIISIRDYWKRFGTSPDYTQMNEDNGFRLLFGQVDTSSCTAARSAKWMREISVMLIGRPPNGVTLNKHTANALVGSTILLEATVGPFDAANKSVTWSSSNPEVATVDQNGVVSVIAPGTAAITVTTVEGGFTASCIVNDPNPGVASPEDTPVAGSLVDNQKDKEPPVTAAGQQHLAPKGSDLKSMPSGKVFELSAEIVPLQPQSEYGDVDVVALVASLILFILGAGRRYTEYTKEVLN
ncbi:MAG: stalk domain-containing protein [Syntrophomonas sp.]|nr:stalk domain-containing protein [Syntrophomonas sp.]